MVCVLVIMPSPDYVHSQGLFDVALGVAYSLHSLGHSAEVTVDPSLVNGKCIVFGAHLLPDIGGTIEGRDYIIFNTEQAGSKWFTPEYKDILSRYPVWEFTDMVGYHTYMENIGKGKSASLVSGGTMVDYHPWGTQADVGMVDVLFYGSMNERRKKVIHGLKMAGLNVACIQGYGAYRDKYIRAAKVVLNMHYYENAAFEVVRVAHLLANRKAVVSENGIGDKWIPTVTYDGLVEECVRLVDDDMARERLARTGYEEFKKVSQVELLRGKL